MGSRKYPAVVFGRLPDRAGRSHRRRPPRRSRLSNRSRQPAPEKPTRTEQHASGRKRTSRVSEKFRSRDFPAQFVQASILRPHRVRPAPRGNVFHFPQRPDRRFLAAGNGDRTFRDLPRDTRRHPGRSGSDGQRRLSAGAVLLFIGCFSPLTAASSDFRPEELSVSDFLAIFMPLSANPTA